MRVRLLGTGSADGWPNPFCECESCASERRVGRSRRPASALIDDVLMIDAGPTAPYSASEAGISLRGVRDLLLTHGHPDHLAPSILLWREWIAGLHELHVWGPAMALDLCRDWVGPDSPVDFHVVAPGETLGLDSGYRVRVLAAAHDPNSRDDIAHEAVLYDITDDQDAALLYATDTGPFTADMLESIAGRYYDLVLVDESFGDTNDHGTGHFDLATLPAFLSGARECGAITASTRVIATHLSHHNPPMPELRARLAALNVEVHDDHALIHVGARPSRHVLITGGVRSGKSHHAERLLSAHPQVTYVATGYPDGADAEWNARIAAHRVRRPAQWTTIESIDVAGIVRALPEGTACLIDCMALWTTRVLDELRAWEQPSDPLITTQFEARVDELIDAIAQSRANLVLVTNEVGSEVVSDSAGTRLFRDLMGLVNRRLADSCDEVVLMTAGRALELPRTTPKGSA